MDGAVDPPDGAVINEDEASPPMKPSVWQSTLEEFRDQVASRQPVPASGCVSAVTANLALNLVVKVLEITQRKKGFEGEAEKLRALMNDAKTLSATLAGYADEDVAAFNAYLNSARLPESDDEERAKRKQAMAAALQQVIQAPFCAASSAAFGMRLCSDAVALVPKSLIADLGSAAALLAGAARALIVSAEFNIRQLAGDPGDYRKVSAQLQDLEREVLQKENSMRKQVASLLPQEKP